MNWNDWEALWRRQAPPIGASADVVELKRTFETKRRKAANLLFARDLLEGSAGLLVAVACGFIWRQNGKHGWPIAFAIALLLGITLVFVRERIRAYRSRVSPAAPLLVKVEAEIAELRYQRQLFQSVWKWYFLPGIAAVIIVSITIARNRPPWDLARDPIFLGGFGVFFAIILWIAWLNIRRTIREQLDPQLAELEKLQRELHAP